MTFIDFLYFPGKRLRDHLHPLLHQLSATVSDNQLHIHHKQSSSSVFVHIDQAIIAGKILPLKLVLFLVTNKLVFSYEIVS